MQGIKRGLFSNEAGMGSAPNVAATASVTHPVKQGLIQTLGVFTDTLLICTCTAFIILFSGTPLDGSVNGVQLTQHALTLEVGKAGGIFVAVAIFLFAFSSISEHPFHHTEEKRALYLSPVGRRHGNVRSVGKPGTHLESGGYHDGFHDDLQPGRYLVAEQTGLPATARLHCSETQRDQKSGVR